MLRIPEQRSYSREEIERMVAWARLREARSRCALSPFLVFAFRYRRLKPLVISIALRLEGGYVFTQTLRAILRRYYDVEVGMCSSLRYWCDNPRFLPKGTRIDNYSSFANGVAFLRRNHPTNRISHHGVFMNPVLGLVREETMAPVTSNPLHVGHDVWIGLNAIVLPSCRRIGDGAVVGAGAVVTRDVEPFTIVAGNPARVIWRRFPRDIEERVRASQWWRMPLSELVRNADLFVNPATKDVIARLSDAYCPDFQPEAEPVGASAP